MSLVKDMIQVGGLPLLDAGLGETVTRHPAGGGSSSTFTGRWTMGETLRTWYPDGQQSVAEGVLRVSPVALPVWSVDDEFTVAGVRYAVLQVGAQEPVIELRLGRRTTERVGGNDHYSHR